MKKGTKMFQKIKEQKIQEEKKSLQKQQKKQQKKSKKWEICNKQKKGITGKKMQKMLTK